MRALGTSYGGPGGVIVNVSSGAATLGSPGEYVQYAAAKAGVDALTVGLAQEVAGEGIRVVGVAPGIVRTTIHADAGEPGRVDRVGPLVPLGRRRRARRGRRRDRLADERRGVVRHRHDAARRRRALTRVGTLARVASESADSIVGGHWCPATAAVTRFDA